MDSLLVRRRTGRDGRSGRGWRLVAVGSACVLLLGACSSGGSDGGSTTSTKPADTTNVTTKKPVATDRPDGPAAALDEELTGGKGVFMGSAQPKKAIPGYTESEYVAAGTATAYTAEGTLGSDGRWTLKPDAGAKYRTRIVVRRPTKAKDFNGTVVMEWLNVSGGVDADPEFVTLSEELLREGAVWVGVSAQLIGVEGGPVAVKVNVPGSEAAGQGIKKIDPARYASLQHPGDAYSFDIYTQVARALRAGAPALGGLQPTHVVATGESQSAFALVTYINGVQPLTKAFDGFFVHSRGAAGLSIPAVGKSADISSSIGGVKTIMRTDTSVPIFDLQTESDLVGILGSAAARQPDTDSFRLWEVPGSAHADIHLAGQATADAVDCGVPVNDGPLHVVAKAAFHQFNDWVDGGKPPPIAPRIELASVGEPAVKRDGDGIALGGLRTPPVDVPTQVLSGEKGPSTEVICLLFGSTKPLSAARLAELYPSRKEFQQRFDAATDKVIDAGFVLSADRAALEGYAHPELVAGTG